MLLAKDVEDIEKGPRRSDRELLEEILSSVRRQETTPQTSVRNLITYWRDNNPSPKMKLVANSAKVNDPFNLKGTSESLEFQGDEITEE